MEYPETLTAPALLAHLGHALTVERHGRDNFTYFTISAVSIDCQTCGEGIALEWTEDTK